MDKKPSNSAPAPEQLPPGGGSYERQEDGSLVKREGTEPSQPKLGPEPKAD